MSEDERGDGVVDVLIACAMNATMKPVRGRFDSEIRSRGKSGPRLDDKDDAMDPSRLQYLSAAISAAR